MIRKSRWNWARLNRKTPMTDDPRQALRAQLQRAPAKLSGASVQMTRRFQDFHKKAMRALDKDTLTPGTLRQLQAQADRWYGETLL